VERVYLEYVGNLIEVPAGELRIGRELDCGVRLDDAGVSRHHIRVVRRGDEVFVEDLGSRNGTLLNGSPIGAPVRVRDGDVIAISTRLLTVRVNPVRRAKRVTLGQGEERDRSAAHAVTVPPIHTQPIGIPDRRCPRCALVVTEVDDECAGCGLSWGSFAAAADVSTTLRRHERHEIAIDVRYVSRELEIEVTSHDLSESGVFVCSPVLEPVGTRCELTFDLVDGQVDARGVVRRVVERGSASGQPVGLGVEFVELGQRARSLLRDLMARPIDHLRRDLL